MIFMKVIKKNQIIIFVFALMLVTAGYMNFNNTTSIETAGLIDSTEIAGIGDAQLVNSSNVVSQENTSMNSQDSHTENINPEDENIKSSEIEIQTDNETAISTSSKNTEYFESSRMEREKMYSQMLETYQEILESDNISDEQKAISQTEISKIHNIKNSIMIAENLLKNKGFNDVIIFVNDNSISVVVDTENLGEAEIAQIQNIVAREIKAEIDDIHISTIEKK